MKIEMKIPSPGESISEVSIANWLVANGDYVDNGQVIAEIDSDKATLELAAEAAGSITIVAQAGDTVAVGALACIIDSAAERPAGKTTAAPAPAVAARGHGRHRAARCALRGVGLLHHGRLGAEDNCVRGVCASRACVDARAARRGGVQARARPALPLAGAAEAGGVHHAAQRAGRPRGCRVAARKVAV